MITGGRRFRGAGILALVLPTLVASATGCNALFGLDETSPGGSDASADAHAVADGAGAAADARTDSDPGRDRDLDGVDDEDDNCPDDGNTDQHNEDGDAPGDVCDNCPHLVNPDQANRGEAPLEPDGVGDECDPNPSTGGDAITFFDGFGDDELAPWQARGGTWWEADDRLVQTNTATTDAFLFLPGRSFDRARVVTALVIDGLASDAMDTLDPEGLALAVAGDFANNRTAGYACAISQGLATTSDATSSSIARYPGLEVVTSENTPGELSRDQEVTLIVDVDPTGILGGSHVGCTQFATGWSEKVALAADGDVSAGGIGFHLHGVAARVAYVLVIGSPRLPDGL